MAFGGSSLAILLYPSIVVKAFARTSSSQGAMQTRIITPQENPRSYLATLIGGLLISIIMILGGLYLFLSAASLASRSASHRPSVNAAVGQSSRPVKSRQA